MLQCSFKRKEKWCGRLMEKRSGQWSYLMISSLTASPSNRFVDMFLSQNCKSSWTHTMTCTIHSRYYLSAWEHCCLHVLQMTWVPNELEGANLILFEFLDLLMEPKGEIQHISTFISVHLHSLMSSSLFLCAGWLLKLWECVSSRGVVVFSASECWSAQTLQEHIGEWWAAILDNTNQLVLPVLQTGLTCWRKLTSATRECQCGS